MACEGCDLLHGWVLPHNDLVERVAVSGYNLVVVLTEHQVTNLTSSVDRVNWLQRQRVPELNASISGTSACGEKSVLMRRPANCFYSSGVLRESSHGLAALNVPDEQFVVVAS